MNINNIDVIAFDADDTLWVNESFFRETELEFCNLLKDYLPTDDALKKLIEVEMQNLSLYGYGIKGFMLSMVETALSVSDNKADGRVIEQILELGKEMLCKPVELLDGVEEVLSALSNRYRLAVATKGDLLDQERKLKKSGLEHYFNHVQIMSDKRTTDYEKLITHLDCSPSSFLMLGNSLKSDILPVLDLGGYAAHIPFHTTWEHEKIEGEVEHNCFLQLNTISEILEHLNV